MHCSPILGVAGPAARGEEDAGRTLRPQWSALRRHALPGGVHPDDFHGGTDERPSLPQPSSGQRRPQGKHSPPC